MNIEHPFVVVIEPGDVVDGKLQWFAKIIGHKLDNMTWSDSPLGALRESVRLMEDLTTVGYD